MRFFCFVFLFSICSFGQTQYPKDYFRSPLDIPLQLSGNFGELRPNHIHAGFDFKTQQKEGLFVYASADGYVSRIKISEVGFGKSYLYNPSKWLYYCLWTLAIGLWRNRKNYKKRTIQSQIV